MTKAEARGIKMLVAVIVVAFLFRFFAYEHLMALMN